MKLSLQLAVAVFLGSVFALLVICLLVAWEKRSKAPQLAKTPQIFAVKVGVLENRRPSPNSKVWVIPESAESQLSLTMELRESEMKLEQERFETLMRLRAHYKSIYKHDTSGLDELTLRDFNKLKDFKLRVALGENDSKLRDLLLDVRKSHKSFIDKLDEMLDLLSQISANTNMDGTATLYNLQEPQVVVYVLPAVPEQFTFLRKSINLAVDHETIIDLPKLPNDLESRVSEEISK